MKSKNRNLEIEFLNVSGKPPEGNRFLGTSLEVEYGIKTWWTTEFYLDGQTTRTKAPFRRICSGTASAPSCASIGSILCSMLNLKTLTALYKTLREIVGHDGKADLSEPNDQVRQEKKREIELKLILGSNQRLERERKHHCREEPCQ